MWDPCRAWHLIWDLGCGVRPSHCCSSELRVQVGALLHSAGASYCVQQPPWALQAGGMLYGPGGRQVEAQGLRRVYITNRPSQPSQHALLWQACTKVRDAVGLGSLERLLPTRACYAGS